jgi:GNAT superfamily N-acetyltransferase
MKVIIRRAEITDAAAIHTILQSLGWFPHLNSPDSNATDQVVNHLHSCLADNSHSVYVAEQAEGNIVGYAVVHWLPYLFLPAPEGFVSELFVDQAHRGEGIGSLLLAAIQTEAKARGCIRLMLVNGRERESYQRQFYQKQGWIERENIANFIYNL